MSGRTPALPGPVPLGAPPVRAWNRLSLRLKLTLGYALIFSVSVLLGALCVYVLARGSLTSTLDTTLEETAALARGNLLGSGMGLRFTDALQPPPELSIELISPDGRILDVAGQPVSTATALMTTPARLGTYTYRDRRVLTVALPDQPFLLQVSRASDTLTALLETLARVLLAGSGLMIGLACLAGYYLADRALKPVDAVARTADTITRSGSYRGRVPPAPGSDEMARLTGTVNGMLDHLEATIEREKSFARTAAHELRTPLTALQGRLEVGRVGLRGQQGGGRVADEGRGEAAGVEVLQHAPQVRVAHQFDHGGVPARQEHRVEPGEVGGGVRELHDALVEQVRHEGLDAPVLLFALEEVLDVAPGVHGGAVASGRGDGEGVALLHEAVGGHAELVEVEAGGVRLAVLEGQLGFAGQDHEDVLHGAHLKLGASGQLSD